MYDFNALSLFVTIGVTLAVSGILAAGWRHKVLIWGLIGFGVVIVLLALAWPLLAMLSPWLVRELSAVATPSAWFTIIMFALAVFVFSGPQFRGSNPKKVTDEAWSFGDRQKSDELSTSPSNSTQKLREEILQVEIRLNAAISDLQKMTRKEIAAVAQDLHKENAELLASTSGLIATQQRLNEVLATQDGKHSSALTSADSDILALLEFASGETTVRFLDWLIGEYPKQTKPVAEQDADVREQSWAALLDYCNSVQRDVTGTHLQKPVQNILNNAARDADVRATATPPDKRPVGVDHLAWLKYEIAQARARALVEYLQYERRGAIQYLRGLRAAITQKAISRDKTKS